MPVRPLGAVERRATAPPVELAPYALVRWAALPYPADQPAAAEFRGAVGELVRVRRAMLALAGPVADALHDSAGGHPVDFHRRVVLPLRRAVHNGRRVRPALLRDLGDLPDRIPPLRTWLDLAATEAATRDRLADTAAAALAAERSVLSALCRNESVRRGATLVGDHLLHGIDRVASASDTARPVDGRHRRAEPNALRYALRATTKTTPLSSFAHVAWGCWRDDEPQPAREPAPHVCGNRALLARLLRAVHALPDVRRRLRYRPAPATRAAGGRITFRRDTPVDAGDRLTVVREEEVVLSETGPVALLRRTAGDAGPLGALWTDLVAAVAGRIAGPPEQAHAAAAGYVDRAVDVGLLVPVDPVHPQDPDALDAVTRWLAALGPAAAADAAAHLTAIRTRERGFATLAVPARLAGLVDLRRAWRAAFATVGVTWNDAPVLTEDLVVPRPVPLGRPATDTLTRLSVLAELFDDQLIARRLVSNRFVDRYGEGGRCRHVAEFATEIRAAWQETSEILRGAATADPDVAGVLRLRATVRAAADNGSGTDVVRLSDALVDDVDHAFPRWMRRRPGSYSFFLQPTTVDGGRLLVLNRCYTGWSRFTSRFLDALGPDARRAVTAQLARVFDDPARVVQYRPVQGFNANLHPLVAAREVGEDPRWADLAVDQLDVRHDPATDQVRLTDVGSGAPLDVLYLGFLMPVLLPDRSSALIADLNTGPVDFAQLSAVRPEDGHVVRSRVRYRNVVLARTSWTLPEPTVAAWRADLDAGPRVPADAAATWAARLGLPLRIFAGPGRHQVTGATDLLRAFSRPKSQYVDLTNALHLRCLSRTLGRHTGGLRLTEALPIPGPGTPDGRAVEFVAETYRKADPS